MIVDDEGGTRLRDAVETCYKLVSVVHSIWKPVPLVSGWGGWLTLGALSEVHSRLNGREQAGPWNLGCVWLWVLAT